MPIPEDIIANPNSPEMGKVNIDDVLPLVRSFFERMTEDQWALLKSGKLDHATQIMLAELLLDLIRCLTKVLLASLNERFTGPLSSELVQSSVGDSITQSIVQALDVSVEVKCVSSERLTKLIADQVTENINISLTALRSPEILVSSPIIPAKRLNIMIGHAKKVIKVVGETVKKLTKPRPPQSKRKASRQEQRQDSSPSLESQSLRSDSYSKSSRSESDSKSDTSMGTSHQVSSSESLKEVLMELFRSEAKKLSQSIDSDFGEPELLDQASLQSIVSEAEVIQEAECKSATPKPSVHVKNATASKIKAFFARCLARACLGQIFKKGKNTEQTNAKRSSSLEEILSDVEELLSMESGGDTQGEQEVCPYEYLQNLSAGRLLVFTQTLSDILYRHSTGGLPAVIPNRLRGRARASMADDIHSEMRYRVWFFLTLMSWWLKTQAAGHSQTVIKAIEGIEVVSRTTSKADSPCANENADLQALTNKACLCILMERLVSRVFRKAKVNHTLKKPEEIIARLFDKVCDAITEEDFCFRPQALSTLDKMIYKLLLKQWCSPEMLLVALYAEDPEIDLFIVTTIKYQLMSRANRRSGSGIGRFFSAVGKVFCAPFRCTSKI